MYKPRVLLIGPFPPPIGGVSIHLKRFLDLSKKNEAIYCSVLDIKKLRVHGDDDGGIFRSIASLFSADIVHIHMASNVKIWVALVAKLFNKRVIYTHHNSRVENKRFFKLLYKIVDILVLVNNRTIDPGFNMSDEKTRVIPAFLPPSEFVGFDPRLQRVIEGKEFVVSANCSYKTDFEGKDLYGFDILIAGFSMFCRENPDTDALLVLVDPSGTSESFVNECLASTPIPESKLVFWNKPLDFFNLVNSSHVVVRSARTDGDSLTVREALFCGTHVIASDCTWRPRGTITYKVEDAKDLSNKLESCLSSSETPYKESSEYYSEILSVYDSLELS